VDQGEYRSSVDDYKVWTGADDVKNLRKVEQWNHDRFVDLLFSPLRHMHMCIPHRHMHIGTRTIFWLGERKLNDFSVGEAEIGENHQDN